jgi:secreted trypsin-like serine protease
MRRCSPVLAVLILLALAAPVQAMQPRIVNGTEIDIASAPWQVGIIVSESELCGGSLIAPGWVVTAAHCVAGVGAASVKAYAGISNISDRGSRNQLQVAAVISHPGYNADTFSNDIALLQLASPIEYSGSRQIIALPMGLSPASWPPAGTAATVTGWGAVSEGGKGSDRLRSAQVQVQADPSSPDCQGYPDESYDESSLLCASGPQGSTDACQGDSGGPLTIAVGGTPVLAGITSVGKGCGEANFPGLYTRVTNFLPWIGQSVPLPTGPPASAAGLAVTATGKGKARIGWTAATGPAVRTTVSAPGVAACTSYGSSCEVAGLAPGQSYEFSVVAANQLGAAASASVSGVGAAGQVRAGKSVSGRQVAAWAKVKPASRIRLAVAPQSKGVCAVRGTSVRAQAAGTCVVTVQSGVKRGTVVIAVSA